MELKDPESKCKFSTVQPMELKDPESKCNTNGAQETWKYMQV